MQLLEDLYGPVARQRALKAKDAERRRTTLEILLANLLAASVNRIDPHRFLAVGFSNKAYTASPISISALRSLRDLMGVAELIEGQGGYQRVDDFADEIAFAKLTRLRAAPRLLAMFKADDIDRSSLRREADPTQVIVLKDGKGKPIRLEAFGAEPIEINASRSVLMSLNVRLSEVSIDLPPDAWARVKTRERKAEKMKEDAYRLLAGDQTTRTVYRVFNQSWDRGGRLYGGWWMQVPKLERSHLKIDGEPTIELDYATLHPTLLFASEGKTLDFDPYDVPGFNGPEMRELGKRTFMRMINPSAKYGPAKRLRTTAEDKAQLPPGASFDHYQRAFKSRLGPIASSLSKGVGMLLQRQDSDLAVDVIKRLLGSGVVTLPIHDSFIVQADNEPLLRRAMISAYQDQFGHIPIIKPGEGTIESNSAVV